MLLDPHSILLGPSSVLHGPHSIPLGPRSMLLSPPPCASQLLDFYCVARAPPGCGEQDRPGSSLQLNVPRNCRLRLLACPVAAGSSSCSALPPAQFVSYLRRMRWCSAPHLLGHLLIFRLLHFFFQGFLPELSLA
jgi:hypothetical protein